MCCSLNKCFINLSLSLDFGLFKYYYLDVNKWEFTKITAIFINGLVICIKINIEKGKMRQIVKSIINPALKLRSARFCFATETKNVFTLPKMYAINPTALNEVTSAISESYTVKMLAYIFRVNKNINLGQYQVFYTSSRISHLLAYPFKKTRNRRYSSFDYNSHHHRIYQRL